MVHILITFTSKSTSILPFSVSLDHINDKQLQVYQLKCFRLRISHSLHAKKSVVISADTVPTVESVLFSVSQPCRDGLKNGALGKKKNS